MDFDMLENMDVDQNETEIGFKVSDPPLIQRLCRVSMTNEVHDHHVIMIHRMQMILWSTIQPNKIMPGKTVMHRRIHMLLCMII
mmetsp:Transcript_17133/g.26194  ORF Transcript_17133/g.26194 Transcript_17133/m.26194 type:complete len:84 (-) Transcript_17133:616-867(-)